MNGTARTMQPAAFIALSAAAAGGLSYCTGAAAADLTEVIAPHAVVYAEIAATPEARLRGLMGRRIVEPRHGMLFLFPSAGVHRFWMKDTFVALDIVFMERDGTVTSVAHDAVPAGSMPDGSLARYAGEGAAVLELPAFEADRDGIVPGIRLKFSHNPL